MKGTVNDRCLILVPLEVILQVVASVHRTDVENGVENVRPVEGLGNHLCERNVQLLLHVLHDVLPSSGTIIITFVAVADNAMMGVLGKRERSEVSSR